MTMYSVVFDTTYSMCFAKLEGWPIPGGACWLCKRGACCVVAAVACCGLVLAERLDQGWSTTLRCSSVQETGPRQPFVEDDVLEPRSLGGLTFVEEGGLSR